MRSRHTGLSLVFSALLCTLGILSCNSEDISGSPDVTAIVVTAVRPSILAGDSTRAIATAVGETGSTIPAYPVTWSSSDTSIATVSASGLVRGRRPGDAIITATGGGITGSVTIRILPVPARSIVINPLTPSVVAGDPIQLNAQVLDSAGNPLPDRRVTWTSETPAVATVTAEGVVQTLRPGQAVIRATIDGVSTTVTVTATPGAIQSLQVFPTFQILYAGGSLASTATGDLLVSAFDTRGFPVPSSALSVNWTSEDPSKVQIINGLPIGVSETPGVRVFGTANGKTGDATIRVVKVVSIKAGENFACFLISTGATYCWGRNEQGELGRGSAGGNTLFPNPVASHPAFVSLDAGANTACGLTADGTAYCWGANWRGQIGDSSNVGARVAPVRVKTSARFSQISVGRYHTCGISTDSDLYCWGQPLASIGGIVAPERVNTSIQFKQISTGAYFQCGLDANGKAWCWGQNEWGQLGNESVTVNNQFVAAPTRVSGDHTFKQIVAGRDRTCGVAIDGQLYCWGKEIVGSGQNIHAITLPALVEGGIRFESIAFNGDQICGLTAAGAVYCRGSVPGNGTVQSAGFVQVEAPGDESAAVYGGVTLGSSFHCVVTTAGLPACWGTDSGSGRASPTFSPLPLSRPLLVPQSF